MANYSYRCECGNLEDHIMSYEESIKEDAVQCEKCKKLMTKYFGKQAPMMIVPIGTTGNADNGYTGVSQVQKDRNAV